MERVIKFFWIVSLGIGLFALLYTYAGLGDPVAFGEFRFSREVYFYGALAILVLFNFTFYAISRNLRYQNSSLKNAIINWQLSFAAVLNLFFIVSVFFIMLVNAGEQFNFGYFGYLLYVCLGIIFVWVVALPIIIRRGVLQK